MDAIKAPPNLKAGTVVLSDFYESWEQQLADAAITAATWTDVDPATGTAWTMGVGSSRIRARVVPNASEFGRLYRVKRVVADPTVVGSTSSQIKQVVVEWEQNMANVANMDATKTFCGLVNATNATRATATLMGFGLIGASNVSIAAVADSSGSETEVNTGLASEQYNKLRMVIDLNRVRFYVNEALVLTETTNLPGAVFWLMYYVETGVGGAGTLDVAAAHVLQLADLVY